MAANNRIFYASQAVALRTQDGGENPAINANWYYPRGLQSVGMTTNFGLEQVFQLGQIEIYDNIENVPEVEVTMSKAIDGTLPLYLLCMGGSAGPSGANEKELVELANNRVNFRLGIWSDTNAATTGSPSAWVTCSGMYLSSVSYTIPVDGNATEDITLVGNNKVWNTALLGTPDSKGTYGQSGAGAGVMTAPALARRYRFNLENSVIPTGSGGGIPVPQGRTKPYLQNVTVSTNLGREALLELGRMAPYHRYVNFPVEVTSEFQITASSGDYVDAADFSNLAGCGTVPRNLLDKTVYLVICGSSGINTSETSAMSIDLGSKNKLTSVNYTGGDTGGGNATITYSYQTFNKLKVTASGDFKATDWVDNTDSGGTAIND